MRRHLPLAVVAAALLAAGCGSGSDDDGGGGSGGGGSPSASSGEELFKGKCGSCHTLAAAGTNGSFGPDLDDLGPDRETVLATIEKGPGAMPAGLVKGADAEAVADYVATSAGG